MASRIVEKNNFVYVEIPYPDDDMRARRSEINKIRRDDKYWWQHYQNNAATSSSTALKSKIVASTSTLGKMAQQCSASGYLGAAEPVWTCDPIVNVEDGREFAQLLQDNYVSREDQPVPKKACVLLDPSEYPYENHWVPTDIDDGKARINGVHKDFKERLEGRMKDMARSCLPLASRAMSSTRFVEDFEHAQFDKKLSTNYFKSAGSKDSNVQVVFKVRQFYFPPDKSFRWVGATMRFGQWHSEGTTNDHIAACVILPLVIDNMRDAQISFRCPGDIDTSFIKHNSDSREVHLGSELLSVGVPIVWKNDVQHRTDICYKLDNTKPGTITWLAMYIVDPTHHLPSTSVVPPQFRQNDMVEREETLLEAPCILDDLVPSIMALCKEAWTSDDISRAKSKMKKDRLHAWDKQNAIYDIKHLKAPMSMRRRREIRRGFMFEEDTTASDSDDEYFAYTRH